jgi:riboflavin kinase / FMN adenylyltransferase
VESYVLDRDDLELYGVPVEVSFVARLRGMVKFDSIDDLVQTMYDDAARAHLALGVPDPE